MKIGETKQFNYRGRTVIIKIMRLDHDGVLGELLTDYIGKNDSWYIGDKKWFQSNLMTGIN